MEETIEGYVDHIIFRNQDNGYTVMVVVTALYSITRTVKEQVNFPYNVSEAAHRLRQYLFPSPCGWLH